MIQFARLKSNISKVSLETGQPLINLNEDLESQPKKYATLYVGGNSSGSKVEFYDSKKVDDLIQMESVNRENSHKSLSVKIEEERDRATKQEELLRNLISTEASSREEADINLRSDFNSSLATLQGATEQSLADLQTTLNDTKTELESKLATEQADRENGDTTLRTSINTHIANKNNPHGVSKSDLGLNNVNNTSDANKPISTATQSALNLKADKQSLNTGSGNTPIYFSSQGVASSCNFSIYCYDSSGNSTSGSIGIYLV